MTRSAALFEAFEETRLRAPQLDSRQLARLLDTSEGEIQSARLGRGVRALSLTACDLLMMLPRLGPLLAVTQSDQAVMRSRVAHCRIDFDQHRARLAEGGTLSMQMLLPGWYWVCLSDERPTPEEEILPCLQIFNRFGQAILKLYALEPDNRAWRALTFQTDMRAPSFTRRIETFSRSAKMPSSSLRSRWQTLRSEEDYLSLLKHWRLRPIEAIRAVEGRYSQRLEAHRFVLAMAAACERSQWMRISMSRSGCRHQHCARFEALLPGPGTRLSMESPALTLSVDKSALREAWVVTRPYEQGLKTVMEAFDHQGNLVVTLDSPQLEYR